MMVGGIRPMTVGGRAADGPVAAIRDFPEGAAILAEEGRVATGSQAKPTVLTEADCLRIEQAVAAAERGTSAEIVPMVVLRSGRYREAAMLAAFLCALFVLSILLLFDALWVPWGWHGANAAWVIGATILAYGLGLWLGEGATLTRLLTTHERMTHKVRLRGQRAFRELGVGQTRARTGLLFLISIFERQVLVLADEPLARQVTDAQWQEVVDAARQAIAEGRIADGVCAGIERCGRLLATAAPGTVGDNPNELPNRVRVE